MKNIIRSLIALAAIPLAIGAQQKVDIRRATAPNVSLRLNGALGHVKVTGWDRDSVAIVGGLAAGSRLDGGPLTSPTAVTGMKFYVEAADEPASRNNRLELMVPRNARVWIKSGSADIDVSKFRGSLDLNIIGGSVKVSGAPRELIIESMDGGVSFDGTADYARIKTATGDVVLAAASEDCQVTSISGNITVAPLDLKAMAKTLLAGEAVGGSPGFSRGRFETVTGSITFGADVKRGGDLRFDSHSGAIELRLSPQTNTDVDVESMTGSIENLLTSRRPQTGREGRGMQLWTSSGTGGASVQVRSFKGNVKLIARN